MGEGGKKGGGSNDGCWAAQAEMQVEVRSDLAGAVAASPVKAMTVEPQKGPVASWWRGWGVGRWQHR